MEDRQTPQYTIPFNLNLSLELRAQYSSADSFFVQLSSLCVAPFTLSLSHTLFRNAQLRAFVARVLAIIQHCVTPRRAASQPHFVTFTLYLLFIHSLHSLRSLRSTHTLYHSTDTQSYPHCAARFAFKLRSFPFRFAPLPFTTANPFPHSFGLWLRVNPSYLQKPLEPPVRTQRRVRASPYVNFVHILYGNGIY